MITWVTAMFMTCSEIDIMPEAQCYRQTDQQETAFTGLPITLSRDR